MKYSSSDNSCTVYVQRLLPKFSMSSKMFIFTVDFPILRRISLEFGKMLMCVFAEIPWLCMHERNQNLLSILSDLMWLPRGHVCVIHVPELQSEFHEYRATGLQVKMVYTRTGISCPQFVHQFFCHLLMHISGFGESIGPITPMGSLPDQWIYANYVVIQYRWMPDQSQKLEVQFILSINRQKVRIQLIGHWLVLISLIHQAQVYAFKFI